jgi:hypothetical protein
MKKIVKLALTAGILFTFSCSKEEIIEPQIIEKEIFTEVLVTENPSLVEGLRLYYYGDEIKVYEDSQKLAGPSGTVTYDLYQETKDIGTSLITGEFNLTSRETKFSSISYKLSINMNNKSCEIIEATKDGSALSAMNLILMLGSF